MCSGTELWNSGMVWTGRDLKAHPTLPPSQALSLLTFPHSRRDSWKIHGEKTPSSTKALVLFSKENTVHLPLSDSHLGDQENRNLQLKLWHRALRQFLGKIWQLPHYCRKLQCFGQQLPVSHKDEMNSINQQTLAGWMHGAGKIILTSNGLWVPAATEQHLAAVPWKNHSWARAFLRSVTAPLHLLPIRTPCAIIHPNSIPTCCPWRGKNKWNYYYCLHFQF